MAFLAELTFSGGAIDARTELPDTLEVADQ
jgi:hypothetical protein